MQGGDLISRLKLHQITVGHSIVIQSFSGSQNIELVIIVIIYYPKLIFLSVQQDRDTVQVVIFSFVYNLHVAEISVNGSPYIPEIVDKHSIFPVHIDIIVSSKIKNNIFFLIIIRNLTVDSCQQIHGVLRQFQNTIALFINVYRIFGLFRFICQCKDPRPFFISQICHICFCVFA